MKLTPATPNAYGFHRGRQTVDRGAVLIAAVVALVAGIGTVQATLSLPLGVIAGGMLFAVLAPLFSATTR